MLYISVLVLDTKMGEIFGLETRGFTTEPILNRDRSGLCSVWDQIEEHLSYIIHSSFTSTELKKLQK